MSREPRQELERWLEAERHLETPEAEAALGALLAALPPVQVSEGFVDRVLGAADRIGRPVWWQRHAWLWRAALVSWLVTGFAALASTLGLVGGVWQSGQAVGLASRAAVGIGRLLAGLLVGADGLARASRAVAQLFSGPSILLFLVICALTTTIAARALTVVIAPERSIRHV